MQRATLHPPPTHPIPAALVDRGLLGFDLGGMENIPYSKERILYYHLGFYYSI